MKKKTQDPSASTNIFFRDTPVSYSDTGKGRVIVFLHGFLESKEIWKETASQLSKKYRVLCIDLPGHGATPVIGYVHTMEMMALCVRQVLKELKIRSCVVVGHSMGGYVSLAFAEQFPDMLKGLILFHSTSYPDSEEKKLDRMKAIRMVKRDPGPYVSRLISKLFAPDHIRSMEKEIVYLKKTAGKMEKRAIVACLEGMKDRKSRDIILKFFPDPILIIAGKQDQVISWKGLVPQLELCQQGEMVMLESSGHMGFFEEKEKSIQVIQKFLQKAFRRKQIKNDN